MYTYSVNSLMGFPQVCICVITTQIKIQNTSSLFGFGYLVFFLLLIIFN